MGQSGNSNGCHTSTIESRDLPADYLSYRSEQNLGRAVVGRGMKGEVDHFPGWVCGRLVSHQPHVEILPTSPVHAGGSTAIKTRRDMHVAPETAPPASLKMPTSDATGHLGKWAAVTYTLTELISVSHSAVSFCPHPPPAHFSMTLEHYTIIGNLRRSTPCGLHTSACSWMLTCTAISVPDRNSSQHA
jgi:hypothetical protein